MDVFEAIKKRYSYRGAFTDAPVPRADLEAIVDAGIRAPSGCNAQTTSFVIVDAPGALASLAAIMEGRPVFATARAMIVCLMQPEAVYHGMAFGPEDCAAAVENMLLAITARGYATVWTDGALRRDRKAERIAERLGVSDNLQVRVILPLGIAAEPGTQKEKQPFGERAWFNRFGGE